MDTIYIRTLKRAEHTVFCVADGQKTYYDPQFNVSVPYSSGQQVKRCLLESLSRNMNEEQSPITFMWDADKKGATKEGEVYSTCNPEYTDQLLGGWMKACKGGKERTVKRRSPLSISAMRGLHPLLSGINKENATFDRSDRKNNNIIVRNSKNEELTEDQISELLEGSDKSLQRKWIPDNRRATGLFVQDMAIDLRRLFTVSLDKLEPEISQKTAESLREEGWKEIDGSLGKSLLAPKEKRDRVIPALANAIVNWTIGSNQARTFSLMETLAVSISDNANKIAGSIRAKLSEEEDNKAVPVIEEEIKGVDTYVTLSAGGYIRTKKETVDALENAEDKLIELLSNYDYEK